MLLFVIMSPHERGHIIDEPETDQPILGIDHTASCSSADNRHIALPALDIDAKRVYLTKVILVYGLKNSVPQDSRRRGVTDL